MNISILNPFDSMLVSQFLEVKNKAYQLRSNDTIPFHPRNETDLLAKISLEGSYIAIATEGEKLIGGIGCSYIEEYGAKCGKIFWLCVDNQYQRKGIATKLLQFVEAKCKADCRELLVLDVFRSVASAIHLYKKLEYRQLETRAFTEGTCAYLRYIKPIPNYRFHSFRRYRILYYSKLKYYLLFKPDNSPSFIHRIIFGKRKA